MADTRIIRDPATAATIVQNPFNNSTTTTPQTAGTALAINPFATLGITNPQTPNYSLNPIPTNTAATRSELPSGGSVGQFLDNFQFQNAAQGTPQWIFNDIKTKYGTNAAWSWALNNAWNDLGGYGENGLRGIMDRAGIQGVDQNRIINTYGSSKSNYWDGYRNDMTALGNPFNPTSAYSGYRTQMQTLHPSNITTNIPNTNTTTPNTNTNTTNPQVNTNNTNNSLTNPYGTVQSASNFQGYNPYINNNLVGNPYGTNPNATGFNSGTGTTTNGNAGDTSINTQLITGT